MRDGNASEDSSVIQKDASVIQKDAGAILKRVPLFAGLDERSLSFLVRSGHMQRAGRGHVIFNQGDDADALYVVCSGRVDILLITEDGRELVINQMHPGDCFGEMALLTTQTRSASAVARAPCQIFVIPRQEFEAQLARAPKLMRRLLQTLSERLRASSEREGALAFLDAPARLARALLLYEQQERLESLVTISQEEMAQRIGVTRQTVARILGDWRRGGWIITGRGRIMLLDRGALRKMAHTDHSANSFERTDATKRGRP